MSNLTSLARFKRFVCSDCDARVFSDARFFLEHVERTHATADFSDERFAIVFNSSAVRPREPLNSRNSPVHNVMAMMERLENSLHRDGQNSMAPVLMARNPSRSRSRSPPARRSHSHHSLRSPPHQSKFSKTHNLRTLRYKTVCEL